MVCKPAQESAKRLAAGPSGRKLGRPVDPSTERRKQERRKQEIEEDDWDEWDVAV